MRKVVFILVLLLIVMLSFDLSAQGCSQCRLLTEQGSELDENSFGSNINSGILYLMAIPYLLLIFLFRKRIVGFLEATFKRKNA
jgi:hypothetical protein